MITLQIVFDSKDKEQYEEIIDDDKDDNKDKDDGEDEVEPQLGPLHPRQVPLPRPLPYQGSCPLPLIGPEGKASQYFEYFIYGYFCHSRIYLMA